MGLLGGGFFGSGASSSKTSQTASTAETGQQVNDQGSAVNLSNINMSGKKNKSSLYLDVVQTDYGTVDRAFDLAENSFEFAAYALDDIEEQSRMNFQQTEQTIGRSLALAGEASRSEAQTALKDFMKWSAVVLIGGGLVATIFKKVSK